MKIKSLGKALSFRGNFLALALIAFSFSTSAQVYQVDAAYGRQIRRYAVDTTLIIPTVCGVPTLRSTVTNKAAIAVDSCNKVFYFYDPKTATWNTISGGGGGTSGISSLGTGYGLITVNDSTYRVDSTVMVNIARLNNHLALKLSLSDTASMLSPYLRSATAAATYATISNIALKVNISDTAAMLLPYARKSALADSMASIANLNLASNYIKALNDSTIYFDSTLVGTSLSKVGDSIRLLNGAGARIAAVYVGSTGVTVTSYGKNAGLDSTILLLSDGTRYAAKDNEGSGGGTPAGSTTEVQYNNAGAFGSSSTFTYNPAPSVSTLAAKGLVVNPALTLTSRFDSLFGIYVNPVWNETAGTSNRFKKIGGYFGGGLMVKGSQDTSGTQVAFRGFSDGTTAIEIVSNDPTNGQKYQIRSVVNGDLDFTNSTNPLASPSTYLKFSKSYTVNGANYATFLGPIKDNGSNYSLGNITGSGAMLWLGQATPSNSNYSLYSDGSSTYLGSASDILFRVTNATRNRMFANGNFRFGTGATDNGSKLQLEGSVSYAYVAKTATYTIAATDDHIECTANTFTVTLPTAVNITGREYTITNTGAGVITIATTSSQTFRNISGTPTTLTVDAVAAAAKTSYTVRSNGANWIVVATVVSP